MPADAKKGRALAKNWNLILSSPASLIGRTVYSPVLLVVTLLLQYHACGTAEPSPHRPWEVSCKVWSLSAAVTGYCRGVRSSGVGWRPLPGQHVPAPAPPPSPFTRPGPLPHHRCFHRPGNAREDLRQIPPAQLPRHRRSPSPVRVWTREDMLREMEEARRDDSWVIDWCSEAGAIVLVPGHLVSRQQREEVRTEFVVSGWIMKVCLIPKELLMS